MYNPQEEKNKPSFLKKIFLLSLYFSSLWPPFLLSIQTFWKRANSFWKKPTILFLFINTSIIITYLLLFCYIQEKKQIFLLYLSIYYWFYSFYYITILMHLKKMITTLQKQKSIKFSKKTKPHMQKFCPRKESKKLIILTSLNLLQKP